MQRTRYASVALAAAFLLCACAPAPPPHLHQSSVRTELHVATLNTPTAYYLGAHATEGLEYELARRLATRLGIKLVMYPVANLAALQAEVKSGRADIAAAQLTVDPSWTGIGVRSVVYQRIPQLVVYRSGTKRPRRLRDLTTARVVARADSPQQHILQDLRQQRLPGLQVVATDPAMGDPLEEVVSGRVRFALVDARELSFARHLFPEIRVGFALADPRSVQWVVRSDAQDLREAADEFLTQFDHSGELAQVARETSGETRRFYYEESREFQAHVASRLIHYRPWFEQAAALTGVDWRLLAAIGYQESKWNPAAESADGAHGIMMLTSATAESLGVTDRADPEQNILAGARYFVEVRKKIPERIAEPDRTWLTLAAYNVGFGHMEDARIITQIRGRDPDQWDEVAMNLPLLTQERWFMRVKRGYARGWEPVQFVSRVRRFLKLLEWQGESVALEPRSRDSSG